ncbi:hypothetical protein Fmac_029941 [Flemingia macrophylla]|uniref:Uncharacterized protein n=1 Tax=Flemingia macrophylla TaxID=520843 RepID=A0ABD1LBS1_9FABA
MRVASIASRRDLCLRRLPSRSLPCAPPPLTPGFQIAVCITHCGRNIAVAAISATASHRNCVENPNHTFFRIATSQPQPRPQPQFKTMPNALCLRRVPSRASPCVPPPLPPFTPDRLRRMGHHLCASVAHYVSSSYPSSLNPFCNDSNPTLLLQSMYAEAQHNCLNAVRLDAMEFNTKVYGIIMARKKMLQTRLKGVQLELKNSDSESLTRLEKQLQVKLDEALLLEEGDSFAHARANAELYASGNNECWSAPEDPYMNINVDGSWIQDSNKMGIGVVILDVAAQWKAAFAKSLCWSESLFSELLNKERHFGNHTYADILVRIRELVTRNWVL